MGWRRSNIERSEALKQSSPSSRPVLDVSFVSF